MAGHRGSACYGDNVPEPCTPRPSQIGNCQKTMACSNSSLRRMTYLELEWNSILCSLHYSLPPSP
eukprot:8188346-Pyramimonas_sp.AAC.1